MQKVAIVGAGIAGLCTAKLLNTLGYEVRVFEKEAFLGGVWSASRRYPGLTTQNPRDTYAYCDFPMPRHYPEWPSGAQMQEYLESYAAHFGITEKISLNTLVVRAELLQDEPGWRILAQPAGGGNGEAIVYNCDWLIVCNGIFSAPFVPDFPGSPAFKAAGGQIMHTSEFTRLEAARDKDVVAIGYGKSSCDAINAVVGVGRSATVLTRELIWKIPKRIGHVLNFKYLFLTRLGEALFPYMRMRGFEKFLHGPGLRVRNAMLDSIQALIRRQLRLHRIGLEPDKPLESIARSTVSLVSDGFYEKVADGRLRVLQDEIARLEPGRAHLKGGQSIAADMIVCGTGWHQHVPFLPEEIGRRLTDDEGNFRLYRSLLPVDVPRLALNGYNSSFFSPLSAEMGSFWIAEHMAGRIVLPSAAEQTRAIDERLQWMTARSAGKHCKGTNIVPFSLHYIDELLADIGLPLPAHLRLKQWFSPVDTADFKFVSQRLMKRSAVFPATFKGHPVQRAGQA